MLGRARWSSSTSSKDPAVPSSGTPEGEQGVITLIRTASILGNGEMQFNYLDNQTLLDAQKNPKDFRDLVVRVAGYSAFFIELCKDVQDEIISRTVLRHF